MVFGVWVLGFGDWYWVFAFGVWCLVLGVLCLGFGVQGLVSSVYAALIDTWVGVCSVTRRDLRPEVTHRKSLRVSVESTLVSKLRVPCGYHPLGLNAPLASGRSRGYASCPQTRTRDTLPSPCRASSARLAFAQRPSTRGLVFGAWRFVSFFLLV